MPDISGEKELSQQQALFTRIADRYDLINNLMTGWQVKRWRRAAVKALRLGPDSVLLDIGSGSGGLVLEGAHQYPSAKIIAADLTEAMMAIGQQKTAPVGADWTSADSGSLPFPDRVFDGVISGFLVRNLQDPHRGLAEQYRVLKPGGRIAVLDTTNPPDQWLKPVIRFHMNTIIPALGKLLTGHRDAYCYLSASTEEFLRPEKLAAYLAAVGFKKVAYQEMTFGVVNVHWGEK